MSAGSEAPPRIPWCLPPSHFLPKHQQRNRYERREEWMSELVWDCSKILNLRFSAHTPWSLWRHHIQAATHSTDEGTRYHLINTRVHRCWRFRRLEENSKSNPFHHTAPERIQLYLCCSQLILKQHLVMLKSWKSKFSNLFHGFNLIIAEPTTCHLAGHRHGERCFTRALWR